MPRLGENGPLGREIPRLGEDGPVGAMPRKESRKPRNESTDRKRRGRGPSRVFSDGRSGGLYSLTLRVDVRSGPTRSIPVWRWLKDDIEHCDARRDDFVSRWFVDKVLREDLGHWEDDWCKVDDHVIACIHCIVEMDRNSTHIRGYHFTMSPEGQWNSDGYRYTYSGPCGLKVHMECAGSSMMIPHPDAVIDASFTLPLRRDPIPGVGVSFPPVQSDVAGPSVGRRTWQDVVDAPSSSRAFRSDGRGAGSCKKSPELRLSSPPNYASGIWHHDMELDDEEEDEVIELVEVESSVEVINLVSDSEEEEDPSEGSSIPGIF
ncbi:unnamed protein product [Lupinus luteus]|uniref:Uncharacterized protein n=1 Tax=Lupinus luteus TaxID=3873 RepID=A0AAV1XEA5_LUPLU